MQKLLFIINPISGGRNKDAIIRMLDSTLDRNLFSHETVLTTHSGHATELAHRSDADIVVAVGKRAKRNGHGRRKYEFLHFLVPSFVEYIIF